MENLEWLKLLLTTVVGLVTGVINTLAGGGSLLTLPILIFMGLPPAVANGSNRVAILAQSFTAVRGFKSKGVSAFPLGLYLGLSALIGALLGARIAIDIDGQLFNRILSVVMMAVMGLTFWDMKYRKTYLEAKTSGKRLAWGVLAFFFLGIYGGFIQAGIGFFLMAALSGIHHLNITQTNSIKNLIVLVYSLGALAVFAWDDKVNWPFAIALALGASLGGWLSSRWSVGVDEKYIRWFLLVCVSVMAIKLWFF